MPRGVKKEKKGGGGQTPCVYMSLHSVRGEIRTIGTFNLRCSIDSRKLTDNGDAVIPEDRPI